MQFQVQFLRFIADMDKITVTLLGRKTDLPQMLIQRLS